LNPIRQREDRTYPADSGDTRHHSLVCSAPITGSLTEKEVNLVIVRVVGVRDGMGGNKLALCGRERKAGQLDLCDTNPTIPFKTLGKSIKTAKTLFHIHCLCVREYKDKTVSYSLV